MDANVLINAKNLYYQFDRVPEFWDWLVYHGEQGNIKIPIEIYEEFKDTTDKNGNQDELAVWANQDVVKSALLFGEEANQEIVSEVIYQGYVDNPTDDDIEKMGNDPFLISYAYKNDGPRCVVSAEVSKPKITGAKRRVPDVCRELGVSCQDLFSLLHALDFRTNWKDHI